MSFDMYSIIYVITNIFFTYTVFKFMRIFFDEKRTGKLVEFLSYAAYFVTNTAIYLFLDIPIIFLVSNILLFFALTFNYISSLKKRVLSAFLIYIVFFCIESIVSLFVGYVKFPLMVKNEFSSILGIVLIRCASYIVVLMISNFKNIKAGASIPTIYWLSILVIPVSSVWIMVTLFENANLSATLLIICLMLLMMINVTTFYLYDNIIITSENKTKALLAAQQNKYYENQLELMKSSLTRAGIFRHDLNNQLSVIDAMVKEKNFDEVSVYVTKLIGAAKSLKNFANSGNINIDSILNFKLSQAEQENIKVTLLLEIPEKLSVCPVDVCSVLGNLLDNAICATCKLEEEQRRIDISVRFDKGRLIVQVDNSFNGQVFYNGEKIISSNKDKSCHGFGLLSVKNIVEKYNGLIDIEHSETEFKVTLLFFV